MNNSNALKGLNIRLIDYEKLMDERGQRVVAFGKYAGVAGMVNIFHGLGLRLLALGHHTPFMHIGPAHNYRNSSMARQAIRDAGYEISLGMMPKSVGPLTFVFTGSGNVSSGAQEVFQELPHEYVPPEMLQKVAEHGGEWGCTFAKNSRVFKGPGVLVCSIDNMPTQLPRESTDFFGDLLYPYALSIILSDATVPLEKQSFPPSVYGAIIASNGKLTPNFEYIQELRNQNTRNKQKQVCTEEIAQRVLVLGAGYVSAPVIEYLSRDKNVAVTVASSLKDEADKLASKYPGVRPVLMDVVNRPDSLRELIEEADVVISLLPYGLHHTVAEACIDTRTNMVTASYCTPALQALHERAVEAGITVVNEVGLDPGIDHLLAMECFEEVRQGGGKVVSFVSYCGGLPAPECSDNALRYKFSWSPRAALLNTLATAKHLRNNEVVEVPAGGELMRCAHDLDFLPGFALEGYPNRDSMQYAQLYGIAGEANTVLRGTLRYRGFSDTVQSLQILGLINAEPHPALHPKGPEITWRAFVCNLLGIADVDIFFENLKSKLAERVGSAERLAAIENLGLLSDDPIQKMDTPLDTLSHYLSKRLVLEPHERDIVILRHDVDILWPDGRRELRGINLVTYGDPHGHSAMARTVGFPAAIAAKMVLDGEIQSHGMVLPFSREIYRPILSRLKSEGIEPFVRSKWL
ncbi:hypothetical protein FOCC_FOCC017194 [Frankliniella occidentalis]|nr:hypothetical protein FOCC_FOCC017194 [Frankliniella occidentalis]